MEILHADKTNFSELVKKGYVLVDFSAGWCGPCKMLGPILENVSNKVQIVKADVDEIEDIASTYGVMSVPTLILFKDGQFVDQKVGFIPEPLLIGWLDSKIK